MAALTPETLLRAYAVGLFPMAERRDDETLYWIDPEKRGILPIDRFHLPRRLARKFRRRPFEVRCDTAFERVMRECAAPADDRPETWINDEIIALYTELNLMGRAHSVECWRDETMVGGLYGVSIGGAFFGESMFSRETDSSKVALVHLVARLRHGGYRHLDTQFVTKHLTTMGVVEISRAEYHRRLADALTAAGDFYSFTGDGDPSAVLKSSTQMS